jgi:hypothetical protein
MKANDLDCKFDENQEDVLEHFDLSTATRINQKQKRINVDFPEWVVCSLDREASRIGVTRQSIIQMWLVERLESQEANKNIKADNSQQRCIYAYV